MSVACASHVLLIDGRIKRSRRDGSLAFSRPSLLPWIAALLDFVGGV